MIGRYYHTVRHLRPSQIWYRLLRKLRSRPPEPGPPPPVAQPRLELAEPLPGPSTFHPPDRFTFLAREEPVAGPEDWSRDDLPLLWLYRLHYFQELTARGAEERADDLEALIVRWVRENPPLRAPGWDPYPTSLRIVSWVQWALRVRPLPDEAVESLALQARHLAARLEYHHRANHLLANAKGLVFAGCFFAGDEGRNWLRKGLGLLREQVREQIMSDGGHFERSPGYHARILQDLLDVVAVLRAYGHAAPESVARAVGPMLDWLRVMTHPDGRPAQLNDTALDDLPDTVDLHEYAADMGLEGPPGYPRSWRRLQGKDVEAVLLPETGYARVQAGPAVAFLDLAPLGPDFNPAHGHADTLTFELSLRGRRVVVDPGVSTYQEGPEREVQRGTPAHNTVSVDGWDSSEVWGSFRVARRAQVRDVSLEREGGQLIIGGTHDGYARLRVAGNHVRTWRFGAGSLVVQDLLEGSGRHDVQVGFLLHPDLQARLPGAKTAAVSLPEGREVKVSLDASLSWALEPDRWHPGFGRSLDTVRLVGRARVRLPVKLTQRFAWDESVGDVPIEARPEEPPTA